MVEPPHFNLPDLCWESIFTFLNDGSEGEHNHHYLKSLSVVSKEFLSITNRLRYSLTIYVPTRPFLHRLFKRFINLTSLDLTCFYGDLDALLSQISCFRLKLTSLNISNQPTIPAIGLRAFSIKITTLKSLVCSNIESIYSTDLFLIAECFPLLEELDLSNPGEFAHHINFLDGLEALSLALLKLRKINLSGHCYVNDSSLLHLCKNCKFLEEVIMLNCSLLTHHGIAYAIRERRQTLRSLSIRWRSAGRYDVNSSPFIDSFVSLMGLTSLDLSSSRISDKLLTSIAARGIPLRRLVLQNCTGYSYVGIFSLLSKCQGIQHLDLQKAEFLNDHHVVELSLFLGGLMSINLSDSVNLTNLALFALVGNCSSLSEIRMEYTTIGKKTIENSNSLMDFVVSPQLKFLHLAYSSCLKDESIKIFASIFPNLQLLDLSNCNNISEEGIYQILRRCCKIRHLNLTSCLRVKLHGMNFEVPQLKVLNLSYTNIDDKTLYVISKRCCGLLQLLLVSCMNVTQKGVEHVVENCTQLREINLGYCDKVFVDIVYMTLLRPSLRKITAPPLYPFIDRVKEFLSHYGCLVV